MGAKEGRQCRPGLTSVVKLRTLAKFMERRRSADDRTLKSVSLSRGANHPVKLGQVPGHRSGTLAGTEKLLKLSLTGEKSDLARTQSI